MGIVELMIRRLSHFKTRLSEGLRYWASRVFALIHPDEILIFKPNSAGSDSVISKLAIVSANKTIPLLQMLVCDIVSSQNEQKIHSVEEFCSLLGEQENAEEELAEKLNAYGSDKASKHNYHKVYASILRDRKSVKALLEIGIGSTDQNIASNMGRFGRPGASIMAFRDFLPNATIYGADIDKKVLFQDERIKTFFIDQTDIHTFRSIDDSIEGQLDVIIDDGLHSTASNLATVIFGLRHMRGSKGSIVIEDIRESAVPLWLLMSRLLRSDECHTYIIRAHQNYMFVYQQL